VPSRAYESAAYRRMGLPMGIIRAVLNPPEPVTSHLSSPWKPAVIHACAAGMERADTRSVLRTGFISTLHP
jgi:hypothetical protein